MSARWRCSPVGIVLAARWRCSPVGIVLAALPVHIALAVVTDLSPDEAYYAAASRYAADRLRPIVDHPPLICWLVRPIPVTALLPIELQVRLPAIVLSAVLALMVAHLAMDRSSPRSADSRSSRRTQTSAGAVAAFLASWLLLPAAGGFVMTPDVPAALGMLATLAWASRRTPTLGFTVATSVAAGLGCLAKVSVLPAALAGFVGAVMLRKGPHEPGLLQSPFPRSAGVSAIHRAAFWLWPSFAMATVPLLQQSLAFQHAHAFVPTTSVGLQTSAAAVVATVGSLLALFSPPVVWLGIREVGTMAPAYGITFGLFGALVLASAALRGVPAEPNWWLPAALPLLVGGSVATSRLKKRNQAALLAIAAAPTLLVITHVIHPWLPLDPRQDPTARLHGWSAKGGGSAPIGAPGIGSYGPAAERCIYQSACTEIVSVFNNLNNNSQEQLQ